MSDRPGLLFVVVGPAGVGKNSLINYVLANIPTLAKLPTATTRAIREGEKEGREHFYLSIEQFEQLIAEGKLLEHQRIHGRYYGMLRSTIEDAIRDGRHLIADIDMLGAKAVREAFPESVITVFIMPPTVSSLADRMRIRGEKPHEIAKRLVRVPSELKYASRCDYAILNDQWQNAAQALHQILAAEMEPGAPSAEAWRTANLRAPEFVCGVRARLYSSTNSESGAWSEIGSVLGLVKQGEQPNDTALRLLSDHIGLPSVAGDLLGDPETPMDGAFLPPMAFDMVPIDGVEVAMFTYAYPLPKSVTVSA